MKIGVAREIKAHEYRVGMTPVCVGAYVAAGHAVAIETGAGCGAGYADDDYLAVGGRVETSRERLFADAEMIVKVKEPQPDEYDLLRPGQLLFTYLHLAAEPNLTQALLRNRVTAVAYESIEDDHGMLPCLHPMSEIAGRLSVQEGAKYLEKAFGGRGILLGGVSGVRRGKVVIVGGGVVGMNAAKIAVGIGADVTVLDLSQTRLAYLDDVFGSVLQTLYSTPANLAACLREADVVIGAVLLPGARAPKLIRREHLKIMKPGAVIVDVAIDQGGCAETSRPTSHDDPIYEVDGIVHYCVTNMPGAVALTSTLALTQVTLRYGLNLAKIGPNPALLQNPSLASGVNTHNGKLTCQPVAESLGLPYTPLDKAMHS